MGRYKIPLDAYDMKPEGMIAYLRYNGWHFNKRCAIGPNSLRIWWMTQTKRTDLFSIDFMPIATIMVSAFHGMMYYD